METLLERKEKEKFKGWSNIPKTHTAIDPEIIQKIQKLQQLTALILELKNLEAEMMKKTGNQDFPLKSLIAPRNVELQILEEELKKYQSEHGEEFFLLLGDSGGGSFKLSLQHLNSTRPNSTQCGLIVGYLEGKENEENLKTAFPHLQSEIDGLQDQSIEFTINGEKVEKVIRIFLGGDYEFLCLVLGHGGACCTNFCVFCPSTLGDKTDDPLSMDADKTWDKKERTMEELTISTQKPPILSFRLDRVVVLPLHIVLGLTKEYLSIFMKAIRELDFEETKLGENIAEDSKRKEGFEKCEMAKLEIQMVEEDIMLIKEFQEEVKLTRSNCENLLKKLEANNLNCYAQFESGKKADTVCTAAGKIEHGFLCGKHKGKDGKKGDEMLDLLNHISECVAKIEKVEITSNFTVLMREKKQTTIQAIQTLSLQNEKEDKELEQLVKQKGEELKGKKVELEIAEKELKKLKGKREERVWEIFEIQGIRFQPLYGEFTMTGGACKKLLEGSDKLVEVLDDKPELKQKFQQLFSKFREIRNLLYRIEPFSIITPSSLEIGIIEGANEVEKVKEICFSFGNFYCEHFEKTPIPKHHFLVFHVPSFISKYLSIGMFAEQGIESLHGVLNALERKLAPLPIKERILRKIQEQHLKTIFNF